MASPSGPRRVGLVTPVWPPGIPSNGIATYVAHIRSGLKSLGVASSVIANRVEGAVAPADVQDVLDTRTFRAPLTTRLEWKARERLTGGNTIDRRLAYGVLAALRGTDARQPLDLFEIEESFGYAGMVGPAFPRPMIVRLHGPWCLVSPALGHGEDDYFRSRVDAERRTIQMARAVSSPSRCALDGIRNHYRLPFPDAVVIPNPVPVQPAERRWRYQDCDKRTVLFVGRFDRLKGADVVLGAFARLAQAVPDAQLTFVGPDQGFRDPQGRVWTSGEYLQAHVPPEAMSRIHMLGEQTPERIAELRRRSFVTMLASRFETFSMTAVEALSHGTPLIAPAAAAIVEIVEHGRNGLLFTSGDAEDAARQLRALFADPSLAQRLAAAGPEDVALRFAPDVVARQMRDFYVHALGRLPSP